MLVSIVAVLPVASAAEDNGTKLAGVDVSLTEGVLLNFYIQAEESLGIDNVPVVDGYCVVTKELAAQLGQSSPITLNLIFIFYSFTCSSAFSIMSLTWSSASE